MEPQPETFHLLGALYVPDPERCLLPEDQPLADRAISLMRDFEQVPSANRHPWDMDSAHQRLVNDDIAWWRTKNVERPEEYIVRPSGSLDASLACILFNPTFSVKDPCLRETFDTSNATISQMERAGFNLKNTLFVDQVARRDISQNVEAIYPEDLWQIHERFLREIWDNMRAVVVICWGSAVRKRLLGTSKKTGWFQNFEVLKLWGRFSGIEVLLELTPNKKSMKRFVLFVKHPSYFFYIQSDKDCARNLRRKQGRPQDLALEVAAKLGQIHIEARFYELSPKLRVNLTVPYKVTMEREGWKGDAAAQLQCAFPSAVLSQQKSHRIRGPRGRDLKSLDDIASLMNQFIIGEVHVDGPLRESDASIDPTEVEVTDKTQSHRRLQIISSFWGALKEIIEGSGSMVVSSEIAAENVESSLASIDDMEDVGEWQDLPEEITALVHDQPGLKFNTKPLNSREDLERAYNLLHNFVPGWSDSPKALGIGNLAMSVLFAYGRLISRHRRPHMDELVVFRGAPFDILPLRCSGCNQQVLDDPFPYWSKYNPGIYVSWAVAGGCGNTGCGFLYASLKPFDDQVRWSAAVVGRVSKEALDKVNARRARKPSTWLLRTEAERGTLPDEIEVKCPTCPQTKLVEAKWTIAVRPTLLIPYLLCGSTKDGAGNGCGNRGYWEPVERTQVTRQPNISRLWSQFAKNGCNLSDYPRDGGVIFDDKTISFRIAKLKELKVAQKHMEDNRFS
ncbi:hypothetical protein N7453_009797 [Penicillium expansum]|nr:hypothetical protein N7453_009797 [Penicillium expansum]